MFILMYALSVVMSYSVFHSVVVQGCVVCSHVHIEDRVTLKDCLIGANFTVNRECKML